MTVRWLGTSSGLPTRDRGLSALYVEVGGRAILLDCGEGTQNTLMREGLSLSAIDAVCVTHIHGDHTFGLPGLYSTMWMLDRPLPPLIADPTVQTLLTTVGSIANGEEGAHSKVVLTPCHEVREVFRFAPRRHYEVRILTCSLKHRVPAMGFRVEVSRFNPPRVKAADLKEAGIPPGPVYGKLQRGEDVQLEGGRLLRAAEFQIPGWRESASFVYLTDTQYCEGSVALSRGASLVSHEATFLPGQEERAELGGHSTIDEALRVLTEGGADAMVMTHFSARNKPEQYQEILDSHPLGARVTLAEDGLCLPIFPAPFDTDDDTDDDIDDEDSR